MPTKNKQAIKTFSKIHFYHTGTLKHPSYNLKIALLHPHSEVWLLIKRINRSRIFWGAFKQGLLYTWTDSLGTFLVTFVIMKISKSDSNIICRSSKNITFSKILRVWLKNWACHDHFNFKLLKGVAVLLSEWAMPFEFWSVVTGQQMILVFYL